MSLTVNTSIVTGSTNSKSMKQTSSPSFKQTLVSTSWMCSRTSRLLTSRGHDISVMNGLSLPKLANNSAEPFSKMSMLKHSSI